MERKAVNRINRINIFPCFVNVHINFICDVHKTRNVHVKINKSYVETTLRKEY